MKIEALEVEGARVVVPSGADPVATGYYYDPATGERYYAYTDPATGVTYWYKYSVSALGYVYALATEPAPKTIQVVVGDRIRVWVSFSYRGPAFSGKLHVGTSMGSPLWTETFKTDTPLSLPKCTTPTPFTDKYADLIVPSGANAGYYYIYAKLTDGTSLELGKTLTPWYEKALEVLVGADFTELEILNYEKV